MECGENKTPAKDLLKKYLTRKIGIVIIEMIIKQHFNPSFPGTFFVCSMEPYHGWLRRPNTLF